MNKYLEEQLRLHPCVQPQDIIKFCFQAVYGADHLLLDVNAAELLFEDEYRQTEPRDIPVSENLSEQFCRVNIAAWKYQGRSKKLLFEIFVRSAGELHGNDRQFYELLKEASETCARLQPGSGLADMDEFVKHYLSEGVRPVHHSRQYHDAHEPAYRVVQRRLISPFIGL